MILIDANILLYAVDAAARRHAKARQFLEKQLSAAGPVGFSWEGLNAFLRISTNARVFESPLEPQEACDYVSEWLAQPCATILQATSAHWEVLRALIEGSDASGNLMMDAHLAAIAIEHEAVLYSSDGDFARFKGLRWKNPLA